MRKLKLFLDTSVYSAIFDKRDPYREMLTRDFWRSIENYQLYYSDINSEEVNAISDEDLKFKMKTLLLKGKKIEATDEVIKLTKIYIKEGLIPERYENQALLLALTTTYSLDVLISWKFKYLVKRRTRLGVNYINLKEGYGLIEILAPPEL
ncbi:MAG: hypothetical protein GF353_10165 [Candidatus Lokiarchaeota archaeon]|nr:hypothetical protein [Candidatus Lokiarchaeota archaeon]